MYMHTIYIYIYIYAHIVIEAATVFCWGSIKPEWLEGEPSFALV